MKKFYKHISLALLCFAIATPLCAFDKLSSKGNAEHNVYIISNTADLKNHRHLIASLRTEFESESDLFTLLLMGDAFDLNESIEEQYDQFDNLCQLILLVGEHINGQLIFMTGDRDWSGRTKEGHLALLELEEMVNQFVNENQILNFSWLVNEGCPGPFLINLDEHIVFIGLNSAWWMKDSNKPLLADGHCDHIYTREIEDRLNELLEQNFEKNIIIAAHHPIVSIGRYGGRFSFYDFFKPLPIYGLFRTAYRSNIGLRNDLSHDSYQEYIDMLEDVIYKHDNVILVSGHEHNHQIIRKNNNYLINSGLVSGSGYAPKDRSSVLNSGESGFLKLSFTDLGSAYARLTRLSKAKVHEANVTLFSSFCYINPLIKTMSHEDVPCKILTPLPNNYIEKYEDELVSAGRHYKRNGLIRFLMGDHYRKEWYAMIDVPVLDLDTAFGGLKVVTKNSDKEALSLRLENADGKHFSFRSVDKDPSQTLRHTLDHSLIGKIFRDQISAQLPYAPLIVSKLMKEIDLLHATPSMYLMPYSSELGIYQDQFGGLLGMIEELPGKKDKHDKHFAEAEEILETNELLQRLFNDNSYQVSAREYLRSRLFDILIADWRRYESNWKWAVYHQQGKKICRPIPCNRDWAFSKWDGLIPSIADLPFGMHNTETFDYGIKGFRSAVFQARFLDRCLLSELTNEDFLEEARFIQSALSSSKIEEAVAMMPSEVHHLSSEELIGKLERRRNDLNEYAKKYFAWLNSEVEVRGTNQNDIIVIESESQDQLQVTIKDQDSEIKCNEIETILFGGKGKDRYSNLDSTSIVDVYDRENLLLQDEKEGFEFVEHWNDKLYDYDIRAKQFSTWFPILSIGYSDYTGTTLTAGNTWTIQRWDKKDFASKHRVVGNISTKDDKGFRYSGQWHHVFGKWDLVVDLSFANPEFYNSFYGIGNSTAVDPTLKQEGYYVAKYSQVENLAGFQRTIWKKSEFRFLTGFASYKSSTLHNTIIQNQYRDLRGVEGRVYTIPLNFELTIDFLDNSIFPYKGIRMKSGLENYFELNNGSSTFGNHFTSFEYYLSNNNFNKLTLGLKFFGERAYGNTPYYFLSTIGGNHGLRGYSSNRFTGDKAAYINAELRFRLIESLDYLIPYEFGVFGFVDFGRVYSEEESFMFSGLKRGLGMGAYLSPLNRNFTFSFSLAWSDEQSFYPEINFGTFLN